ncbi:uncharacterized protein LY89DRAFT_675557 [Mollisia scopiformis]|uniref:Uncharacterized protein n=1 Tax=Mollisia scopiformis TaxID=149040 RepID=A0A132BE01_MOLSC|nr:uncharacterized protein LY89DRAFT_675557 [Mollisia scopiformis]KUJ10064.1 hypothetical protein LY89DRAFT_675557 [Mollisia scopiformis]
MTNTRELLTIKVSVALTPFVNKSEGVIEALVVILRFLPEFVARLFIKFSVNIIQISMQVKEPCWSVATSQRVVDGVVDPFESLTNEALDEYHARNMAGNPYAGPESPSIIRSRTSTIWNHLPDKKPKTIYINSCGKEYGNATTVDASASNLAALAHQPGI